MKKLKYIPEAGDLIWMDFDPIKGREQKGHRPAIVVSNKSYNEIRKLFIVCPITSQIKNQPFEVAVQSKKVAGVILADHVKSNDWRVRNVTFIEQSRPEVLYEVKAKIHALID